MQVKGTQVGGGGGSKKSTSKSVGVGKGAIISSSKGPNNYYEAKTRAGNTGSSPKGYDYNAAEQARLEAERQKRIKENEKYITNIQSTNAEIKDVRDKIDQAKELLANAVSGDKYKEYSKYLEDQDKWLSQIGDDLNSYGAKAAQNIKDNGGAYTFNKTNTAPAQDNNKKNNKALSVNTDELQKLVTLLDDINTSARSIDSKVSGILNDSSKLGIQKSYNAKDNSRNVINSTITLKDRLQQQIRETEKTEKENKNIIDGIGDWFNNCVDGIGDWFKSSDDKKVKDLGTDEAKKEHITIKNIASKDKLIKQFGTDEARKEHIEIQNRNTNVGQIKEIAKNEGIDTKGKTYKEIVYELADKYNVPTTDVEQIQKVAKNKGINTLGKTYKEIVYELADKYNIPTTESIVFRDNIWDWVIELDQKASKEQWRYGPTPSWVNVEGALNPYNKAMQCGSLVSIPLILGGFLTEDDIRGTDGGVQYNSPSKIREALIKHDCDVIRDSNELQPGDILCYFNPDDGTWNGHIEWFVEYGSGKNMKVYSSGGPGLIQTVGPTNNTLPNEEKIWEAYRLPEVEKDINDISNEVIQKEEIFNEPIKQPINNDWDIPAMKD